MSFSVPVSVSLSLCPSFSVSLCLCKKYRFFLSDPDLLNLTPNLHLNGEKYWPTIKLSVQKVQTQLLAKESFGSHRVLLFWPKFNLSWGKVFKNWILYLWVIREGTKGFFNSSASWDGFVIQMPCIKVTNTKLNINDIVSNCGWVRWVGWVFERGWVRSCNRPLDLETDLALEIGLKPLTNHPDGKAELTRHKPVFKKELAFQRRSIALLKPN